MADEVNVLVNFQDQIYSVCKFAITDADSSMYLLPISKKGLYRGGIIELVEIDKIDMDKIQYKAQYDSAKEIPISDKRVPKLSLHQSGNVHADVGDNRIGPLKMGDFRKMHHNHIATVHVDNLQSLKPFNKSISASDVLLNVAPGVIGCRFLVHVDGITQDYPGPYAVKMELVRPQNNRPIVYYVSHRVEVKEETINRKDGVIAITGWNSESMDAGKGSQVLVVIAE